MENIGLGLTLMAVGMITVFAILLIVINLSRALIVMVNKFAPEEGQEKKVARPAGLAQMPTAVDAKTMAVIEAAVQKITGGAGTVAKVERI